MLIPFKDKIPQVGANVFIAEGAKVIGEVQIGDESSIWFNCVLRGDINLIKIGKRSNIQDLSTLHTWGRTYDDNGGIVDSGLPVIIGDDVTIGHNCVIHACVIKDRVLIGMNAFRIPLARGDNTLKDDPQLLLYFKDFADKKAHLKLYIEGLGVSVLDENLSQGVD